MMKLWTIQPVEVMDIINTTGIFRCDEDKNDNFNILIRLHINNGTAGTAET